MKLIIAEKPVLGRAIADALPGTGKTEDGYITKGDYIVIWAFGHLLELKDPEDYDPAMKNWSLDTLPIYYPNWGKKPGKTEGKGTSKAERLKQIGSLLKQAEYVIHAGDPDDEGQYLIDEILQWFDYKGKVYRINTNDTTTAALKKALAHLEPNSKFVNIGWSAHARSVADIMVGYNCSRYFSLKNPEVLLTVGRVQTATLGLVVQRDAQIENHVKQIYYEVFADIEIAGHIVRAKYIPKEDDQNLVDGKILSKDYACHIVDFLSKETLQKGVEITEKPGKENPPLPFNLTELQSYCSKKFGYDPTQVLNITQSLRDNYNAITYNRSDCQYLSEEQFKEAPATMQQVIKNIRFSPKELKMSLRSKCFNSEKITAHTAIIPQNNPVDVSSLPEQEKNVYLAICKYYMAQFMPPAEKIHTKLRAALSDGAELTAASTRIVKRGFLTIFKEGGEEEEKPKTELSDIAPGTYPGHIASSEAEEKETRPPARYTKASLGKDMTCVSKYVNDPTVKQILLNKDKDKDGENGSIGTVATRPYIIDRLVEHGYLKEDGKKSLVSTPLGRELFRILPDDLKYPDITAYWWAVQDDIAKGKKPWTALTDSVLAEINIILKTEYPKVDMSLIPDNLKKRGTGEPLGSCPLCGCDIVEGKKGFGCSGYKSGCKFVIWKDSKFGLLQKTRITAASVKKWLGSGWETELDDNGALTGKQITKGYASFKKLYSKTKDKTFEGNLYLRYNPVDGFVDTKLAPFENTGSFKTGYKKGSKKKASRR